MAMGVNGVNPVLSHLDANKPVSASTWNRDIAAIQFIYRACGTLRWDWMMESKLGRNSIHKRAKARRNSHGHLLRMHAIHNQLVTPGDFGQQNGQSIGSNHSGTMALSGAAAFTPGTRRAHWRWSYSKPPTYHRLQDCCIRQENSHSAPTPQEPRRNDTRRGVSNRHDRGSPKAGPPSGASIKFVAPTPSDQRIEPTRSPVSQPSPSAGLAVRTRDLHRDEKRTCSNSVFMWGGR